MAMATRACFIRVCERYPSQSRVLPSTSQQPGAVECIACGATFLNCDLSGVVWWVIENGMIQLLVQTNGNLFEGWSYSTKKCWIHVKWCLDDWWSSRFKRHRSLSTQTRHAAHGVPARPMQAAPPTPAPRPAARPASGGKWACSRRALRIWEFWKALQFAFWKESEL